MNDLLTVTGITLAGFFLGALPFSVWIGRYGVRKNIRAYGDGNPGAFNVIRAGGLMWGGLAIFLDVGKGALPVGVAASILGLTDWALIIAAIAPIFGHAFSPFLGFKGGKAIATSGGIWIGLTMGVAGLVVIIMLVYWYMAVTISGWAVMLTAACLLLFLLLTTPHWSLLVVWLVNVALLAYKHRHDLQQPLRFKLSPLFRPFFSNTESI